MVQDWGCAATVHPYVMGINQTWRLLVRSPYSTPTSMANGDTCFEDSFAKFRLISCSPGCFCPRNAKSWICRLLFNILKSLVLYLKALAGSLDVCYKHSPTGFLDKTFWRLQIFGSSIGILKQQDGARANSEIRGLSLFNRIFQLDSMALLTSERAPHVACWALPCSPTGSQPEKCPLAPRVQCYLQSLSPAKLVLNPICPKGCLVGP